MNRALIVVAFIVLAVHLYAGAGRSFWEDEVATLRYSSLPASAIMRVPERYEGPFFLFFVKAWLGLGTEEWVVRSLPILIALAGAGMAYALFRRILPAGSALSVLILFALSPAYSLWSREVRPYGLYSLLTLAMAAAWWTGTKSHKNSWIALAGVFSTMVFWMHYAALLYAAVLAIWTAFCERGRSRLRGLWLLAGPAFTVALVALVWPALFKTITNNIETQMTPSPGGGAARIAYGAFVFALGETVYPLRLWIVIPAAAAFAVAGILGVRAVWRRDRQEFGFWMLWALLPILLTAIWGTRFGPRYLVPSLAASCAVVGVGISSAPGPLRMAVGLAVFGSSIISSINDARGRDHHNMARVEPVREVADWIRARGFEENDELVLAPQHQGLEWYLRDSRGSCLTQRFGMQPRGTGRLYYLICSPGQAAGADAAREGAQEWTRRLGPPDERRLWCEDPLAREKSALLGRPFLDHRFELFVWIRR